MKRVGFYANPATPAEEPTITVDDGPMGGTRANHPAFGQISAYRVQGTTALYGSDFLHRNYIVVKIHRSELHRSLSRDWTHEREPIVEVALSEAQWASFVSAMNVGGGTQCTIEQVGYESMPRVPDPVSRGDQFRDEMLETVGDALKAIDKAIAEAEAGKVKASIRESLRMARQELMSNVPFVVDQFGEHVEKVGEQAKTEIHGYMVATIQRAGLEALTGGHLPLQLEEKVEEAATVDTTPQEPEE